ncbi:MAG: efflux RND transporter permease subunit [Marinifilaceae bacterium]
MYSRFIRFFLEYRLISIAILIAIVIYGLIVSPFSWGGKLLPKDPIPVEAIPDIGPNQQIVTTTWEGRSPEDIQDQITYPLTTILMGVPGVQSIRSTSMYGVSFIYIIFENDIDFYWSRSRVLESLSSIPPTTLPDGVNPIMGPDATALGMVYWYTLAGVNPETGEYVGGWSAEELRTIQDFYVKYQLETADGIAQVASIGGYVKEYQVDVDPNALRAYNITIDEVANAISNSNLDVGIQTVEINKVEYIVRGLGYIEKLEDVSESVITIKDGEPIKVKNVAFVTYGPATRRGGLDVQGSDAVGAAVITRFSANPQESIKSLKAKIAQLAPMMPEKQLNDSVTSRVTIVPFYDQTGLINETIETLEVTLSHEILISIIVIFILVLNLKASFIIAGMLPIGVLATFILMKLFHIEGNVVALSGIAIAIGVMVDMGIVLTMNLVRWLEMEEHKDVKGADLLKVTHDSIMEVSPAMITAMIITIISFLPVFGLQAAEGKMFHPLAFTKSFAIICSLILSLTILPPLLYIFYNIKRQTKVARTVWNSLMMIAGILLCIYYSLIPSIALVLLGLVDLCFLFAVKPAYVYLRRWLNLIVVVVTLCYFLSYLWLPLGGEISLLVNFLFVLVVITIIMSILWLVYYYYKELLIAALNHKYLFLVSPLLLIIFAAVAWQGWDSTFGFLGGKKNPANPMEITVWDRFVERFPGLGQEFMPTLDEGSFLLMPTSMPTSGVVQNQAYLAEIDKRVAAIPEVAGVVGKWGRANTALDPNPIQMFSITVNYRSEYISDVNGIPIRFKTNKNKEFVLINDSVYNPKTEFRIIPADSLVRDRKGRFFRQWRSSVKNKNDIWDTIVACAALPGLTTPPKLQPIQTHIMMLSTGMTANMGLEVFANSLEDLDKSGNMLQNALKEVPAINAATVYYSPATGSPYIQITLKRDEMARYGLSVNAVQKTLSVAIGGIPLTRTVQGRESFNVRVRYPRELRENVEQMRNILVATPKGTQIPLSEVANIDYVNGAKSIKSQNSFLVGYVIFNQNDGMAPVNTIQDAQTYLAEQIANGNLKLPKGTTYSFAGDYQNETRASKRFGILVPLTLVVVFLILYLKFKNGVVAGIVFTGVFVAFAGGFILLWLYSQPWFMNFDIGGVSMRSVFHISTIDVSVAVWVGFIALLGISTDDGILMANYIEKVFRAKEPTTVQDIHDGVVQAGLMRVRSAVMTTACAVIALLPLLSSSGKGSTIMIPMGVPLMGGMLIQIITMFTVPVCQCMWRERRLRKAQKKINKA